MRASLLLGFALVVSGCAHSKPVAVATVNPRRIVERVFHDGWRTCGEISVSSGGQYSWVVSDVWSTPTNSQTFTGQLPDSISQPLLAESRSFEVRDGIRTYEVGIDDTKSRHPAGVDALRSYLHETHLVQR